MATWVEDIVQALKNLGGQAHRKEILQEIKRIRKEPLPTHAIEVMQGRIEAFSSDSAYFKGKDLFKQMGNGVWALRAQAVISQPTRSISKRVEPISNNCQTPDSFDEIGNILRTMKQYRDYQHPDSLSWKEYVDEFFHILGFSTEEKNPRLMTLNLIGSKDKPRAIVGFIHPGENFEEMVPGLTWESFLFFAANYYQVDWGILTDGLQLKIIPYQGHEIKQPAYWPDLDAIVCQEKLEPFFTIYKMFSYIKGDGIKPDAGLGKRKKTLHGHNKEDLAERHILRLEFWNQLLEKAKTKTKLHAKVSPGIDFWVGAGAGKSGLLFVYQVRIDNADVELYIDRGEAEWNKSAFNTLYLHKAEIEDAFGKSFDWQLLPDKRASRIRFLLSDYGLKDQDHWVELQEQMLEAMIRFENAFRPFIQQIDKVE